MAQDLSAIDSCLRWLPDLLAIKDRVALLVDCKAQMTSRATRRHTVEGATVRSHLQMAVSFDIAVYYVFDDLGVLTPMDVSGSRADRSGSGGVTGARSPCFGTLEHTRSAQGAGNAISGFLVIKEPADWWWCAARDSNPDPSG
jgi:hypothetical protein